MSRKKSGGSRAAGIGGGKEEIPKELSMVKARSGRGLNGGEETRVSKGFVEVSSPSRTDGECGREGK